MTRYATKDGCCPPVITGVGGKRPENCPCGNRFQTEAELRSVGIGAGKSDQGVDRPSRSGVDSSTPRKRSKLKRSEPKRDWSLARTKVEEEGCCRICKRSDSPEHPLEACHVLGREHDEPKIGADGWPLKELLVHPDRIFPGCGPFPAGCHGDVDYNRINYMGYLTLSEQLQAVKDAGGIAEAYRALMPVERREERERSAA